MIFNISFLGFNLEALTQNFTKLIIDQAASFESILRAQQERSLSSVSNSCVGGKIVKCIQKAQRWDHLSVISGKPSIMTEEDIGYMSSLKNEAESNCFVQCKMSSILFELELRIVNSETLPWLSVGNEGSRKNDLKPDFFVCNPCLYDAREGRDDLKKVQERSLNGEIRLLYGTKVGRPQLFLDDIVVVEGKPGNLDHDAVGQVQTYAAYMNDLYKRSTGLYLEGRLALFNRKKFILFTSSNGVLDSAKECEWTTPGSVQYMTEFFAHQSDLNKALKECCSKLEVSLCTPLPNEPCFLGAGGNGFVFRVKSSDNSVKAMKLVLGKDKLTPLAKEVNDVKEAKKRLPSHVITVGKAFIGEEFGAYLMEEVGEPLHHSKTDQINLFSSLYDLHINNIVHGDARMQNVIFVSDRIVWIDFACLLVMADIDSSECVHHCMMDFDSLYESAFKKRPSKSLLAEYSRRIKSRSGPLDALGVDC